MNEMKNEAAVECSLRNGTDAEVLNGVNEPAASTWAIRQEPSYALFFALLKGGGAFDGIIAEAYLLAGTLNWNAGRSRQARLLYIA